jgi:hypothetical protein
MSGERETGAQRLLKALLKAGLEPDALKPAATIALWLDSHPIKGTAA